ncbi:hypothetical protein PoMZ_02942 [Pyricularia oryzae]|uniref:Uncharacterized protein n=1 Tax=Pyricularia oryzae TaxID=318829 RepID=A0A4P7N6J8_PYROR|nr:hypothetical protein PoMZ_02942 [Pyricularia oryzae]
MKIAMEQKRLVKQAVSMVRSTSRRTGMTGCGVLDSHQMNPRNMTIDNGIVVRTRGCDHGTRLPPAFRPSSKSTRNEIVSATPVKSILEMSDRLETFGGIRIRAKQRAAEISTTGTWTRKARRQPKAVLSLMNPPKTPPSMAPEPYATFPIPWKTPRCLRGMRSDPKKVEMDMSPPPPMPATTRPRIIISPVCARPQIRLPAANMMLLKTRPGPRPKRSVMRPEMGWKAALAISHDMRLSDLNSLEICPERVANIVPSTAPKKTPTYDVPRMK